MFYPDKFVTGMLRKSCPYHRDDISGIYEYHYDLHCGQTRICGEWKGEQFLVHSWGNYSLSDLAALQKYQGERWR